METNAMNREKKTCLFLSVFSVAVSACTAAPTFTYADWADSEEVILERVELNGSTSVVVPDNVTAIGQYAFAGCAKMTSVVIPAGVQQIGEGAFFMCSGLTSVKVPDSVTSIGARAFEWCSHLATVTLGAGVSEIGPCAFHDGECSIKKFVVSGQNEAFKVSGGMLLTYDGAELVACPSATKGTVSVPYGVTTILPMAFYDCDSVSSVTFPSTLTEIQSNAFHDCGSITSIALPASVEKVGNEAFRKCKRLATVVVNGESIEIGENAFSDNAALTAIVFAKAATVNEEAFIGTGSKCTIYVPDGSEGWPVEVPGRWNGVPVNYAYTPGTAVALETAYSGYKITGLPKGWKWNSSTGRLTGKMGATFTVTFTKGSKTVKMTIRAGAKPVLSLSAEETGTVTFKGAGAYAANTKVKIIASPKKGYAFAGWYTNDVLIASGASASVIMPKEGLSVVAKTMPLAEDHFSVSAEDVELAVGETIEDGASISCDSGTPYTLAASGLPDGVKLSKNATGEYVFSGKPRKAGIYYAKVSGKNNGGYKMTAVVKFTIGDVTETLASNEDFDISDLSELQTGANVSVMIPLQKRLSVGTVKNVTVTGLPKGLSAKYPFVDAEGDCYLRITGRTMAAGSYKVTATATCTNKKTAKSATRCMVTDRGSFYLAASLAEGSEGRGTVAGGGVYSIGQKVKLTAKPKDAKKYFFARWEIDSVENAGALSSATYTFDSAEASGPVDALAYFVTKAEDEISLTADGEMYADGAGVSVVAEVSSVTKPVVKASGLPAGIKWNASSLKLYVADVAKLLPGTRVVTLTAKNASGNTATAKVKVFVPNITSAVDNGRLLDLDTSDEGYLLNAGMSVNYSLTADLEIEVASGWVLSLSGLPSGWKYNAKTGRISGVTTKVGPVAVTFTVKKGKTTDKATATFNLQGLPDNIVGSYVGSEVTTYPKNKGTEFGTLAMTVTAGGKISGSYTVGGDKTSFSATGVTYDEENKVYKASATGKVDGKTKKFAIVLTPGGEATFSGTISSNEKVKSEYMLRDPWKSPDVEKSSLPVFAGTVTATVPNLYGSWHYNNQKGELTLAFGANGTVKATFKTPKGSVVGNMQITSLDSKHKGFLVVGISPNKKKKVSGLYGYIRFRLDVNEDNQVTGVTLADYPWSSFGWKSPSEEPYGVWSDEEFPNDGD